MSAVNIEVVLDTTCPWCFIGKRRFERALSARPRLTVNILWRPFLLNPDMPPEGMAREDYLERKFGGGHRVKRLFGAVHQAGQAEGLDFDFARIRRTPNTVASHRLIRFAGRWGRQSAVVDAVFAAYFLEGRDIGEHDVLAEIGEACGLPGAQVKAYLASTTDLAAVQQDNARAHRIGVNGVPCFVFEETYALAGAQEPDVFMRLIDLAQETRHEPILTGM